MGTNNLRRRLFIDRSIQGTLLLRGVFYWILTVMTQVLMVLFIHGITSSPDDFAVRSQQLWWHLELAVLASALILPVILLDCLQLSHRWVGPIFRLRASLQSLSRGETVKPIKFREGDYWQELAGDFNVVSGELDHLRAAAHDQACHDGVDRAPASSSN